MKIPSAQLKIWIPGQNFVAQGKVCEFDGKMAYLAEMTATKWFRNYSGYAIAKRLLDSFQKVKFSPVIVYYRLDLNTYYTTTRSNFIKKGILVGYGGHSQYVLPITAWKAHEGKPSVPKDFPSLSLTDWEKKIQLGQSSVATPEIVEDFTISDSVRLALREKFYSKFPDLRRVNG